MFFLGPHSEDLPFFFGGGQCPRTERFSSLKTWKSQWNWTAEMGRSEKSKRPCWVAGLVPLGHFTWFNGICVVIIYSIYRDLTTKNGDISANTSQFAMGNGPFIDDLPIGMVISYSYVKLPEGRFGVMLIYWNLEIPTTFLSDKTLRVLSGFSAGFSCEFADVSAQGRIQDCLHDSQTWWLSNVNPGSTTSTNGSGPQLYHEWYLYHMNHLRQPWVFWNLGVPSPARCFTHTLRG